MYEFDFQFILDNPGFLWAGLKHTLALYAASLTIGLALGLVIGMGRYSTRKWLNWPATIWVELFRNTPVLVQMMWFFFALPVLIGFSLTAFTAATMALAANASANAAEIFRAGIQSIHKGQWEASRSLGMSYGRIMRRIILPQAIRRMVPAFSNRAIELAKMTSLASTISYAELLYEARLMSSMQFNPIEAFTAVAVVFFVVLYPLTRIVARFEVDARI
ncbi:amino acid ABC transporter permease [Alterinioella nitratireducens]|jgi:polar amino acid transport system permease protein|uniref:amino acid ABC transporter permease n=1 Tax=Alterinioella nitratireducens TaxID=2735915 RepID=UPI00325A1A2C